MLEDGSFAGAGAIILVGLALIVGCAALGACFATLRRLRAFDGRLRRIWQEAESGRRVLGLGLCDLGVRADELERLAVKLRAAQDMLENSRGGPRNYGQAIDLVQRGWRQEDLVATCGLSQGEAELVYFLHGPGGAMKQEDLPRKI
jgi:hypothetical protein